MLWMCELDSYLLNLTVLLCVCDVEPLITGSDRGGNLGLSIHPYFSEKWRLEVEAVPNISTKNYICFQQEYFCILDARTFNTMLKESIKVFLNSWNVFVGKFFFVFGHPSPLKEKQLAIVP